MWEGTIKPGIKVSIECHDCDSDDSCNYNGECGRVTARRCDCDEGYFGQHCEFSAPCDKIRSEKDENTTLSLMGSSSWFDAIYGRPLYVIDGMTSKPSSLLRLGYTEGGDDGRFNDDFFQYNNESSVFQVMLKNYSFVLRYTGLRWYGKPLSAKCY